MRNELTELELIDNYLFHQLNDEDTRIVETKILLNDAFAEKVEAQRHTHRLIRLYGRTEQRSRLEKVYRLLQGEPAFANEIKIIFA